MEVAMKRILFNTITLAAITLCLTVISASAQGAHRYQSSIPFDFTVGDQAFKAGDYTLTVVNPESDKTVFAIRNLATGEARLLATTPKTSNARQESAALNFMLIDGQHYLATVTGPELSAHFRLSNHVREWAKNSADGGKPAIVAVAVKRN
jgi:hypothetical protein